MLSLPETPHNRERKQILPQHKRTSALEDHFCRRQSLLFQVRSAAFVKTSCVSTRLSLSMTSLFPSSSEVCTYQTLHLHLHLQILTPQWLLLLLVLLPKSLICSRFIFQLHFPIHLHLMAQHPPSLTQSPRTCNHMQPAPSHFMRREQSLIDLNMEYSCSIRTSSF